MAGSFIVGPGNVNGVQTLISMTELKTLNLIMRLVCGEENHTERVSEYGGVSFYCSCHCELEAHQDNSVGTNLLSQFRFSLLKAGIYLTSIASLKKKSSRFKYDGCRFQLKYRKKKVSDKKRIIEILNHELSLNRFGPFTQQPLPALILLADNDLDRNQNSKRDKLKRTNEPRAVAENGGDSVARKVRKMR